jgi:hypothetical protein
MHFIDSWKQFPAPRLGAAYPIKRTPQQEPVMTSRIDEIDCRTSRSICEAVGERLQQNLRPDVSGLSPRLQQLLYELRKQDHDSGRRLSN